MKSTKIGDVPQKYVVIFESGEEISGGLEELAKALPLGSGQFTANGAFSHVILGFFDPEKKVFIKNVVDEQSDVLSLIGDIALLEGHPTVHAHVVVGLRNGSTRGGHLLKAIACPMLEVVLEEATIPMRKEFDPQTGLALIV